MAANVGEYSTFRLVFLLSFCYLLRRLNLSCIDYLSAICFGFASVATLSMLWYERSQSYVYHIEGAHSSPFTEGNISVIVPCLVSAYIVL